MYCIKLLITITFNCLFADELIAFLAAKRKRKQSLYKIKRLSSVSIEWITMSQVRTTVKSHYIIFTSNKYCEFYTITSKNEISDIGRGQLLVNKYN